MSATYTLVPEGDMATPTGVVSSAEVALPPVVVVSPDAPALPMNVEMGGEHVAEPSNAIRLSGQARQAAVPLDGAYVPTGHFAQAVEFTLAENVPAGHEVHADAPGPAE
jgi:hypothetical protein